MKLLSLLFIFFISSVLLVFVTIEKKSQSIYDRQMRELKQSMIQAVSSKTYKRTRKFYVPKRSYALATYEIEKVLLKKPIDFELKKKNSLLKIATIANHVKEDIVLSIDVHSNVKATAKENLYLSQKKADELKQYFVDKTDLPLVVAIGYGDAFSLKEKLIKIKFKRIKQ